jgi:hypothetical protein
MLRRVLLARVGQLLRKLAAVLVAAAAAAGEEHGICGGCWQ